MSSSSENKQFIDIHTRPINEQNIGLLKELGIQSIHFKSKPEPVPSFDIEFSINSPKFKFFIETKKFFNNMDIFLPLSR